MILITIDNNRDAFRVRMNRSRTKGRWTHNFIPQSGMKCGKNHFWGSSAKIGVLGRLAKLFGIR